MIPFIKSLFRSPKYKIFKSKNDQYYFILIAKNGETILKSEGYKSEQGALSGIESVSKNGISRSSFDILSSKDNKYYFNLKAKNGEIVGTSETYSEMSSANIGINSVINCCKTNIIKFDY